MCIRDRFLDDPRFEDIWEIREEFEGRQVTFDPGPEWRAATWSALKQKHVSKFLCFVATAKRFWGAPPGEGVLELIFGFYREKVLGNEVLELWGHTRRFGAGTDSTLEWLFAPHDMVENGGPDCCVVGFGVKTGL
eukprot:TRINITY_DN14642_c0_g1_i1.p2 TRINITY_DN14642_c0_g1~~TRINITY_DN14642_c0_g1_i1.p2  ORF type:complete len:135 (-),score=18.00 TRINITY_DN14642_c0_g1_i1:444-848(-)